MQVIGHEHNSTGNLPENRGDPEFHRRGESAGVRAVHRHHTDQAAGGGTRLPPVRTSGKKGGPDFRRRKAVRLRRKNDAAGTGDHAGGARGAGTRRHHPAGRFRIAVLSRSAPGAAGIQKEVPPCGHPPVVHHA